MLFFEKRARHGTNFASFGNQQCRCHEKEQEQKDRFSFKLKKSPLVLANETQCDFIHKKSEGLCFSSIQKKNHKTTTYLRAKFRDKEQNTDRLTQRNRLVSL